MRSIGKGASVAGLARTLYVPLQMTIQVNSTEKAIVAGSIAAILFSLIGIAQGSRGILQLVLGALVALFSSLTIVFTVRAAHARASSLPPSDR